jgi:hypothetical protein
MRNAISPEAHRRNLYPPLFIGWLELMTWPLVWWLHTMPKSEGRASET